MAVPDLFGTMRIVQSGGKAENERATLIRYFAEKLERTPKLMGIRLAHYDISLLYSLKSQLEDRARRDGNVPARKWLWYITRTTALPQTSSQ